jgi:hypothetical protein
MFPNSGSVSVPPEQSIPWSALTSDHEIRYEDRLISRSQLSRWFGVSINRLNLWARKGYGPIPRRIGGYKCMYVVGECLAFVQAQSADLHPDVRKWPRQTVATKA